MTVRSTISAACALAALWLVAGCGRGERIAATAETDDSGFRQGQQLLRQGGDAEALATFLKVIDRRGEDAAPESHLYAGQICLQHSKDPIAAIYHFRKYLEQQPNTPQAKLVRGLIETARREYARTLPGHPLDSQVVGIDQSDQIKALQQQVDDLKAENSALRSLASASSPRVSHATIDVSEPASVPPAALPAQIRVRMDEPSKTPAISAPAPKANALSSTPKSKPGTTTPTSSGRKYTVGQGDTLFGIAKRFGVKMEDLAAANHDILPTVATPLRKGAELKIP